MSILFNDDFLHQDLFFVLYQSKLVWQLILRILSMQWMMIKCNAEDSPRLVLQEIMGQI